ncbi:hypothetical protein Z945_1836 [Sulfitobacter noctilucae]|uniref:hypothetical protein n=1 Tax=Sulfitobacter noctilucae TaxID=1342302 RepID=UPI0004690323|nr:hypothetical protein [Sulfitobacter noctilucae]KIN60854.1 hypothetical protein Z945_1836 [Sulfitobacter noctilucae]
MIGVVLWSDLTERKAVFWCEDQGDLAYYGGSLSNMDRFDDMKAGDMVSFDLTFEHKMRIAHNAKLVETKACKNLADRLRDTSRTEETLPASGDISIVVPFPQRTVHAGPERRISNA